MKKLNLLLIVLFSVLFANNSNLTNEKEIESLQKYLESKQIEHKNLTKNGFPVNIEEYKILVKKKFFLKS